MFAYVRYLWLVAICLCGPACRSDTPTYAGVQQTAVVARCWPDSPYPTPLPATVTPPALAAVLPGTPTPPAWHGATTTPYPRCTPGPHATRVPWPTPHPPPPPYPTGETRAQHLGSAALVSMELPGGVDQLDLAVHPIHNWPVVAMLHGSGLSDAPQTVMVRVMDPTSGRWSHVQQVDAGRRRLVRVATAGWLWRSPAMGRCMWSGAAR